MHLRPTIRPTQKQHEAWEALKTKDIVFFGGGAGGGKSWWLCETRLVNCYFYPGYKSFIGRQELKRLMQSTYVTWKKVCSFHKIPDSDWKLNGQYNYIEFRNGSRIDLLDLQYEPRDPMYERFGSLEYTDGAIEEAGEIHFLAYDVLKSRKGRHLNRELGIRPTLAITGNPKKNWTYREFYKPWKTGQLPNNYAYVQALYGDNPYTAKEYGDQLSQIKDNATRRRLRDGIWEYDEGQGTLVEYDAITDLWTNTVEVDINKYLIADVARYGGDRIVIGLWQGFYCYKIIVLRKQGVDQTSTYIDTLLRQEGIPRSHVVVDDDGVGGGVVDNLRGVKGFVNNSSPLEDGRSYKVYRDGKMVEVTAKENFYNLKSQCAWKLAELINKRGMSLECADETLKAEFEEELNQLKQKDQDKEGKLQLIPKDEMKENLGRSPDLADMLIMRMFFTIKGQNSPMPIHISAEDKEFYRNKLVRSGSPSSIFTRL